MADNSQIHTVLLADIEPLSVELARQVGATGFVPDVIVCIEEAARLPALYFRRVQPAPIFPLRIQRPTSRWRRLAAPVASRLPRFVQDWLRGHDARRSFHVRGERLLAADTPGADFAGLRVLILDDASDSGSSLLMARAWVESCGASPADVRTAVITVTAPLGREVVDFTLMAGLCRFPWSSDSSEARAYRAERHALQGEFEMWRWKR